MTKEEFDMLKEIENIRHENKIKEIEAERQAKIETENLSFDHHLQIQRIRSAEISKTISKKSNMDFIKNYSK